MIHVRISKKGGCYFVLRTDVFGGWSDCRGSALNWGGRGHGPTVLGSARDWDLAWGNLRDHGAPWSGCVTGMSGCRQVPGVKSVKNDLTVKEKAQGFYSHDTFALGASISGHRGVDGPQRCSFSQLLTRREREEVYDE